MPELPTPEQEAAKPYTVGNYLHDRLVELKLAHLFSIAGDYSIDWIKNYIDSESSKIEVIEEVNELNAGYAADAYARLNGIGALCVTYSAGSLSATNAIAGAYVERAPVVLINGAPSISRTLKFEQTGFSAHHFISGRETDLQVFQYITEAAVRVDNPDLAPMLIDYALTQCITERRPVYIELLEDMVDLECKRPTGEIRRVRSLPDPAALSQSIATIKEQLEKASNPLIWVGVEVGRYLLQEEVESLLNQLQIPYVTQLLSKAVLSEKDKLFVGVLDGKASSSTVQDLAQKADFILALGVWLTDINSLGWNANLETTAFASLDTVKFGTTFYSQVPLGNLIDGLLAATIESNAQTAVPDESVPIELEMKPEDTITYQGFYDFMPQFIKEDIIIGSDASLNYFGSIALKVGTPGGFIAQSSYSSIGYIGPAATGMCLARRDKRVMVFSGDGGFQMSPQCLSTQTRFKLNPIIFVINNGVYGVENWLADARVFHDQNKKFYKSCVLHNWEYSKLAEVFGCKGWKVGTYKQLGDAVREALDIEKKPSLIEVMVPPHSAPYRAMWKEQ